MTLVWAVLIHYSKYTIYCHLFAHMHVYRTTVAVLQKTDDRNMRVRKGEGPANETDEQCKRKLRREICIRDWIMDLFATCACGSSNIAGRKIKETKIDWTCLRKSSIHSADKTRVSYSKSMSDEIQWASLCPPSGCSSSSVSCLLVIQLFCPFYLIFCISLPHTHSCVNCNVRSPEHWLHRRFRI